MMIAVKDYEKSRREYFERKAARAARSLKWWLAQKPGKRYDGETIDMYCADLGAEISYLEDAIRALEGK